MTGLSKKFERQAIPITASFLVTSIVLVVPSWLDPIIFPRFLLTVSFSLFLLFARPWRHLAFIITSFRETYLSFLPLAMYLFSLCIVFFSSDNLGLSIFGAFARNLGLLHYLSMTILLIFGFYLQLVKSNIVAVLEKILFVSIIPLCLFGIAQSFGFKLFPYELQYNPVIGSFANPNFFSQFLALCLIGSFRLISVPKLRVYLFSSYPLAFFAFYLNRSIQGPVALFAIALIAMLLSRSIKKQFKYLVFFSFIVTFFLSILQSNVPSLIRTIADLTSLSYRINYIEGSISIFRKNLFLGSGIDNFESAYNLFRTQKMVDSSSVSADNAHSLIFQVLATQGVFSCLFITIFFLLSLLIALRFIKNNKWQDDNFLIACIAISFLLSSLISIENYPNSTIGWLSLGILHALHLESKSNLVKNYQINNYPKKKSISHFRRLISIILILPLVISICFRVLDFRFLTQVSSNPQFSSSEVLEVLSKEDRSPINILKVSDPRILYELCKVTANREVLRNPSLAETLDLINFVIRKHPSDLRLLELKAQLYEFKGKQNNELQIRQIIKKLDPFNPVNVERLSTLQD